MTSDKEQKKRVVSSTDMNFMSDRPQDQVMQMMDFRAKMGWSPLPERIEVYRRPGIRRQE